MDILIILVIILFLLILVMLYIFVKKFSEQNEIIFKEINKLKQNIKNELPKYNNDLIKNQLEKTFNNNDLNNKLLINKVDKVNIKKDDIKDNKNQVIINDIKDFKNIDNNKNNNNKDIILQSENIDEYPNPQDLISDENNNKKEEENIIISNDKENDKTINFNIMNSSSFDNEENLKIEDIDKTNELLINKSLEEIEKHYLNKINNEYNKNYNENKEENNIFEDSELNDTLDNIEAMKACNAHLDTLDTTENIISLDKIIENNINNLLEEDNEENNNKDNNKEENNNKEEDIKYNNEILEDLITGPYKYQELIKKCKEYNINVSKMKKKDIIDLLKSLKK